MHMLLQAELSNAIVATVMALAVFAITRIWRNPHVSHLLWLLVLIKLITPPVIRVPFPQWPLRSNLSIASQSTTSSQTVYTTTKSEETLEQETSEPQANGALYSAWQPNEAVKGTQVGAPTVFSNEWTSKFAIGWQTVGRITVWVWLIGSIAWLGMFTVLIMRFGRSLSHTLPASEKLQSRTKDLAQLLGLVQSPEIRIAEARVSPLVWAVGRQPVIILPIKLIQELGCDELDTLIVHELAHIRRRDHIVRWLELVVVVLNWWNPVVWWARRELRMAEEECSDAWVRWVLPEQKKSYISALLKTVQFLNQKKSIVPVMASSIGNSYMLKRRLEMILKKPSSVRLSWLVKASLFLVAVFTLPLSAQRTEKTDASNTAAVSNVNVTESESTVVHAPSLKQIIKRARQASRALDKNLRSAAGIGTFYKYVKEPGENNLKIRTEVQLKVFYAGGQYHIRANFKKSLGHVIHIQPDGEQSIPKLVEMKPDDLFILFDGDKATVIEESKRIHPSGYRTTMYKDLGTAGAIANIPWCDVMNVSREVMDLDKAVQSIGLDAIEWTHLPNGCIQGAFRIKNSRMLRVEFEMQPESGYHVTAKRTINTLQQRTVMEAKVDWEQSDGAWYVQRISKQYNLKDGTVRKSVFVFDELIVNPVIDPWLFTLESAEYPQRCALAYEKHFETLWLQGTNISDGGLKHVGELKALETLFLTDTRVSDEGLKHLRRLDSLKRLYPIRTAVTDIGLMHLVGLKNLESLDVSGTRVTEEGVENLEAQLPNCKVELWLNAKRR